MTVRAGKGGEFGVVKRDVVRLSLLLQKSIYNAEKKGKKQVLIRPSSKVVIKFLQVMQKHGEREETGAYILQMRLCPTGWPQLCCVCTCGDSVRTHRGIVVAIMTLSSTHRIHPGHRRLHWRVRVCGQPPLWQDCR